MKINTNTWHYQLYCYFDGTMPTDLCRYIRKIIFGSAIFMFVFFLFILLLLAVIELPLALFLAWLNEHRVIPFFDTAFMVASLIGYFTLSVWLFIILPCKFIYRKATNYNETHEPTLVGMWLKAKKSKYCPLLEVK